MLDAFRQERQETDMIQINRQEKEMREEGGWVDEERKKEEVGERAAWRLKKEAAGPLSVMGHAGLFALHFKVTSRPVIGHRPWAHERLTQLSQPIRRRQRASLDGFEIARTFAAANRRIIHTLEQKVQVASTQSFDVTYLSLQCSYVS